MTLGADPWCYRTLTPYTLKRKFVDKLSYHLFKKERLSHLLTPWPPV